MTSLLWAAKHGHVAIVQKLLDNGADVHASNEVIANNLILHLLQTLYISLNQFKITAIELARQYDHDVVVHILDIWIKQVRVYNG